MKKLISFILLFTVINCSGQGSLKGFTRTCGKDSIFPLLTTTTASPLPKGFMNIPATDLNKDTLGVRPIIDNRLNLFYKTPESVQALTISQKRIYIDSTYLQLIIQELERHGYTLVKLPKKTIK